MSVAVTWTFNNGATKQACTSFPYAFRYMFNTIKKATENGKNPDDLKKSLSITSPLGKNYNFLRATELATQQGLLNSDGSLNTKEFKKT